MSSSTGSGGAYFGAGILLVIIGLVVVAGGAITVRDAQVWEDRQPLPERERFACEQASQDNPAIDCSRPENPHQGGGLNILLGAVAIFAGGYSVRRAFQ